MCDSLLGKGYPFISSDHKQPHFKIVIQLQYCDSLHDGLFLHHVMYHDKFSLSVSS